jgi:hypothetical protein
MIWVDVFVLMDVFVGVFVDAGSKIDHSGRSLIVLCSAAGLVLHWVALLSRIGSI